MFFSHPQEKRTTSNCRKSEGETSSYNCMLEVRYLPALIVPLLSVCVTNNTDKTFSMFSRDPSRTLTLSQHCTRHTQWATIMSMWACFPPPFSIHWYAAFSAMGKLAWAFVSNRRAVCSIFTKQAFYSLNLPGKSYVPQVGVGLVRIAYFNIISQKLCLCIPFDIPAAITLHMYNLSVHDKHERVHRGFSYPANFVWWDQDLQKSFYGLFPALYYRSILNDQFVYVIGVWY